MSDQHQFTLHDAEILWGSRFTTVAGFTLILYDTLLTLGVEVKYLWSKPWTHSIKSIYLINKYLTIFITFTTLYQLSNLRQPLSINYCKSYVVYGATFQLLSEIMSKWILTLRLVAVYAQNKAIVRSLYIIYGVSYLACAVFTVMAIRYNEGAVYVIEIGDYCAIESIPAIYSFIFIAPLIYEVYMAILTIRKAILHARFIKSASSTSAPVLHVMFRDGITYFVMVAIARIILIWLVVSSGTLYLGLALQWQVDTVLVCRFYLNLLEVASSGSNVSIWGKQGFRNVTTNNVGTELGEFAVNPSSTTDGGGATSTNGGGTSYGGGTSHGGKSGSGAGTSTIINSHTSTAVDRAYAYEYGRRPSTSANSITGRARSVSFDDGGNPRGKEKEKEKEWATLSHSNGSGTGLESGSPGGGVGDIPPVPNIKSLTTVDTPPWISEKGKHSSDSKR